ncbi:MAG: TRAP transporter small permease subunit [Burkholderiales bacterium]|nr:TRAP transporter small permease subunit [Burkholderiales bacterium]
MHPVLSRAVEWIRRRAENVVAALLAVMFVAFIVQIVFRYFLNLPVGWTSELSVVAWLYMVLLGSAFWLKEDEEIRFDLITGAVGARAKSLIALAVSVAAVVLFGMALPATVSYVAFMKVESSSYLKIRMDLLYSVYVVFAVAVVVRYAWAAWRALQGEAPEEVDIAHKGHGL